MAQPEKEQFIQDIKKKINQGFYFTDLIFTKIADDLTPVMSELSDKN
jgi:hypothetical protein